MTWDNMGKGEVQPGSEWFKQTYFESIASAWLVSDFLEQNFLRKSPFRAFFLALIEGLGDQDKKGIAFCKKLFDSLDDCVKQDPQHKSMAKTGMSEKQQLSVRRTIPGFSFLCNAGYRILAPEYSTLFFIMA